LYNNAKIQGYGIRRPGASAEMTVEEARHVISAANIIDDPYEYVRDRVLKVELSGDDMDERFYDRDNGEGKAARVIAHLRETGSVAEII